MKIEIFRKVQGQSHTMLEISNSKSLSEPVWIVFVFLYNTKKASKLFLCKIFWSVNNPGINHPAL